MYKSIPAAQNVKVTKTNKLDHNVVITWDPVNGAEAYIVRRYKGNSAIPAELGTVTATSYTDSAIEPGEYSWQIVAVPSDKNYTDNIVLNTNSKVLELDQMFRLTGKILPEKTQAKTITWTSSAE